MVAILDTVLVRRNDTPVHAQSVSIDLDHSTSQVAGSSNVAVVVGAVVGAVCAVALVAALLTLTLRRRRHSRQHSTHTPDGQLRRSSLLREKTDAGSPVNLRATAAFQNIWQSVDLGRNSLPQTMTNKSTASSVLAMLEAQGGLSGHAATDSSGSSTAIDSRSATGRRTSTELLDGFGAAQAGYDPDAQPVFSARYSLHDSRVRDENTGEEGCDLGEMAVVVVAGGEEVAEVFEGMQLADFYVTSQVSDLQPDPATHAHDAAPSPLYTEFTLGDQW